MMYTKKPTGSCLESSCARNKEVLCSQSMVGKTLHYEQGKTRRCSVFSFVDSILRSTECSDGPMDCMPVPPRVTLNQFSGWPSIELLTSLPELPALGSRVTCDLSSVTQGRRLVSVGSSVAQLFHRTY